MAHSNTHATLRRFLMALSVLVFAPGCLFTKQHYVIDVPFGLALGWATYELFMIVI